MKKYNFSYKALFISLWLLAFASCKSSITSDEDIKNSSFDGVPDSELVTPYADMYLLERTRSAGVVDPDVVNWKVARFFAIVKKIEFENIYSDWIGAKISAKPIVIYYPDQNKPKFYEFRVIKNGIEIGSISCNASKKDGQPVSYVSQMSHKVTAKIARELVSNDGFKKLSEVNYPSQFVMQEMNIGVRNTSGVDVSFKNALTCEEIDINKVFIEEKFDKILEGADDDFFKKLEITREDGQQILTEMKEREEIDAEMWQDIDSIEDKIIAMSDEEIETKMHMTVQEFNRTTGNIETKGFGLEWTTEDSGIESTYYLTDWKDKKDWVIDLAPWCGPAALTYFVLGLGEKSGCNLVPTTNDSEKIKALYYAFEAAVGTGPAYLIKLNVGLKNMTKRKYRVQPIAFHRWQSSHNHLVNYRYPLLSLRIGRSWKDPQMHYRLIIGDGVTWEKNNYVRWWRLFRWTWEKRWTQIDYYRWYYMRDHIDSERVNGKKKKIDFWEIAGRSYHSQLLLLKKR